MKAEIKIPSNLNEIRLDQYQKYLKLVAENEPSEFVNQQTIKIFCDLELTEVAKISYHSVKDILNDILNVFETKPKFKQIFEIGGKKFGFIPNLDEMTYGEYTDIETYITDANNWHKLLAVLYRPIVKSTKGLYEIEPYLGSDKYSGVMKYAPLDVAISSRVFFYDLASELESVMINSLRQEVTVEVQEVYNLIRDMVGTQPTMPYLGVTYFNLKQHQI